MEENVVETEKIGVCSRKQPQQIREKLATNPPPDPQGLKIVTTESKKRSLGVFQHIGRLIEATTHALQGLSDAQGIVAS